MKYLGLISAACAMATTPAWAQETLSPVQVEETATDAETTTQELPDNVLAAPVAEQPAPVETRTATLPANTEIMFRMDKTLASDKRERVKGAPKPPKGKRRLTNAGDSFTMTVINDVTADGVVIIPQGSIGHGEVIYVTGKGSFGKSGKIEIKMNHVEVGDQQYPLTGTYLQKGKGRGGAAVAGTVIAGVLAGVFIKGSEADIPLGAEIAFRTAEDITTEGPVETSVATN